MYVMPCHLLSTVLPSVRLSESGVCVLVSPVTSARWSGLALQQHRCRGAKASNTFNVSTDQLSKPQRYCTNCSRTPYPPPQHHTHVLLRWLEQWMDSQCMVHPSHEGLGWMRQCHKPRAPIRTYTTQYLVTVYTALKRCLHNL